MFPFLEAKRQTSVLIKKGSQMPTVEPLSEAAPITVSPNTTPPSHKMPQPAVPEPEATEPEAVEVATPEVPNEPEEIKKKVDPRFLALAKKEKDILRLKKEVEEQKKLLEQTFAPWKKAAELSKTDKLAAIKELGISYDDLTNSLISEQDLPAEVKAAKMAEQVVNKALSSFEQRQQEAAQKTQEENYQRALNQITEEVKATATAENFPLVNKTERFDTVTALIEQVYQDTGRIMPVQEAITEVETYLEEQTLELAQIDKLRAKLFPSTEPAEEGQEAEKPEKATQPVKTLTHKTTVSPPAPQQMTAAERRKRAEDIFYGRA